MSNRGMLFFINGLPRFRQEAWKHTPKETYMKQILPRVHSVNYICNYTVVFNYLFILILGEREWKSGPRPSLPIFKSQIFPPWCVFPDKGRLK